MWVALMDMADEIGEDAVSRLENQPIFPLWRVKRIWYLLQYL